jgi:hypothetical protein
MEKKFYAFSPQIKVDTNVLSDGEPLQLMTYAAAPVCQQAWPRKFW